MKSFKMKNRVLAALLCLMLVGGVATSVFLRGSEQSEAAASLSGITTLLSTNKEYNILEIVPDVSQAAFAWYVGDSEPVNSRKLTSAYGSDVNMLASKYQETTAMLQGQNYLMSKTMTEDATAGILQYLGPVEVDGSGVTGGFVNNDWFQRYVFDWTDGEEMPNVKVSVISPENVTAAHINLADMVVISGGYYYPEGTVSPMAYNTDASGNFSTDVASAIITNAKKGLPVILDRRAYNTDGDASLESNRIFHELLGNTPEKVTSGVYGSVFYFSAVTSGSESSNNIKLANGDYLGLSNGAEMGFLVTPQFNQPFDASISGESGPFGDVLTSIKNENNIRNPYQDELLSEEITMARVVRYLIGGDATSNVTSTEDKESVTILSIQPGDSSGTAQYSAEIHDRFNLSAPSTTAQVGLPSNTSSVVTVDQVTWEQLESWTGVSRENITVVEMSVSEFVRQTESVSAVYDMVYIGNDISAATYGLYQETAVYNVGGQTLASDGAQTFFGPLGEDFLKPSYSYSSLLNDISVTKYEELISFVQAGRPVVLAPYLAAGLNYATDVTSPSTVFVDPYSVMYRFLEKIAGQPCVFRQDVLIAGPDGIVGNADDTTMLSSIVARTQISKPTVEFATLSSSIPTAYSESTSSYYAGTMENTLQYIFKVTNSGATSNTIYAIALSLDIDGDGRYELLCNKYDSFQIEQLQTDNNGNLVLDSNSAPIRDSWVDDDELQQDKYYRVSVELPDTITGLVPWQIQVTAVNDIAIATLSSDLTYISTDSTSTLNILQIYNDVEDSYVMNGAYDGNLFPDMFEQLSDVVEIQMTAVPVTFSNLNSTFVDEFDLLIISSCLDTTSNLSTDGVSAVQKFMSMGNPIIFVDSAMSQDELPFYNGIYYNSEARLASTTGGIDHLASEKFFNYPYEISLEGDEYVVYNSSAYYTNVPVSDVTREAKIIMNLIATAYPFMEYEEDNTPTILDSIHLWADENGEAALGKNTLYFMTKEQEEAGSSIYSDSRTLYFSLSRGHEHDSYYFNVYVESTDPVTDSVKEFSLATAPYTSYTLGTALTGESIYTLDIPSDLYNGSFTITATDVNTSSIFAEVVIYARQTVQDDNVLNLFEMYDSGDSPFIPMG